MTPDRPGLEIIGVVGNTRWQDPSQPAPPMMFRAVTQGTGNSPSVLVRTSLDDAAIATTLRRVLNDADSTVPVEIETMNAMFDSTLRYPRFRTQVIGLFAALATALSAVGIFSLLAYLIRLRARELALRQALGARRTDVVRLVVGQGLRLIGIGLLLGLAGALGAARLLTGLLFEIGPGDIATYMGTIVVLGGVGLISIFIPALRAATAAPLSVLQGE
jgi:putative ABC transport system permease protein